MRRPWLFLLLTCLLWPTIPQASETGTVIGEGARTCKEFYKADNRKKNSFIIWVQGYFSAYNAIAPDIQNVAEGRDYFWIQKKLETFCKTNPEEYFNEAVVALIAELHPKGITTNTESQGPQVKIQLPKP